MQARQFFGVGWMVLLFLAGIPTYGQDAVIPFIENKNQWPAHVQYGAKLPGGALFVHRSKLTFHLMEMPGQDRGHGLGADETAHTHAVEESQLPQDGMVKGHVWEVEFSGSNPGVILEPVRSLATLHNYYLGSDPSKWGSRARSYEEIHYRELYCGVDLLLYSQEGNLKYDLLIAPGADPGQVRFSYHGADRLALEQGSLVVYTSLGEMREMRPYSYQYVDGQKVEVLSEYKLEGEEVSFLLPMGYDECEPLFIDPLLIFSAYSGSTYDNWGNTATYDDRGNVYSGGMVRNWGGGTSFPTTTGAYQTFYAGGNWDVGILKYDSAGQRLLYATYLGGVGVETPQSLVVDQNGNLLILGATSSTNFPVTNGSVFQGGTTVEPLGAVNFVGGTDLFVAKLSADGSQLLGATYVGGSGNDGVNYGPVGLGALTRNYGDALRGDIITDSQDHVYFVSNTMSTNFPIVGTGTTYGGGTHDAVVVKLASDLSEILWSRYVGGSGADAAYSIKVSHEGKVFVAGGTTSSNFEGMDGHQSNYGGNVDGFIVQIAQDGSSILHGTYLGTQEYDQVFFIDLDEQENVLAYGQTKGQYPVTPGKYHIPNSAHFLHKLGFDLQQSVYSTVFGTGGFNINISPTAFLVNDCDNIYLAGWGGRTNSLFGSTTTSGLPTTPDAIQRTTSGSDFYLMVLSEDASELLYATFFGGNQSATHVDGGTSRFDKRGIVYHAVCAGCGGFSDFPAVNVPPAFRLNRSSNCNNAVFKFDLSTLRARLQTNNLRLNHPGLNTICLGDTVIFQNLSVGGEIFEWDLGDGTKRTLTTRDPIIHVYKSQGNFPISLKAIDENTCIGVDIAYGNMVVNQISYTLRDDARICEGDEIRLTTTGGVSAKWTSSDGKFASTQLSPMVQPVLDTRYYLVLKDANGCEARDTVDITVVPALKVDFKYRKIYDCFSRPELEVENLTQQYDSFLWDFGDGTTSSEEKVVHRYMQDSDPDPYRVTLVARREFCVFERNFDVYVRLIKVPNFISPGFVDGKNDTFVIETSAPDINLRIFNRWGRVIYTNENYQNEWSAENHGPGVYFYEAIINNDEVCTGWIHVNK
jgi:hypothetical protein